MDLSGTGTETGGWHVYILPETAGGRQPVPEGMTVEKSRKLFVFCLFSGFRDTDVPERCPWDDGWAPVRPV